jgi:short subunit dehydrogenase-like uncharacterized protein
MSLRPRQRGPIALYGATGYTGRLVASALAASRADFVLSGRNRERLEALSASLDGTPGVRSATLDDPHSLRSLLDGCAAVIDCAGPFSLHGEPVLRAAVETGTHYLDTTGEQPYIRMAFERYGPLAQRAGVAAIPAMGFDFAPGDMLASLVAEGMGEIDEVTLAYAESGFSFTGAGATRGTMLSALGAITGGDLEWRKLQWLPAPRGIGASSFDFGEPLGRRRMARYPAGEQITVPRHIPTRRVRTVITSSTLAPHPRLGPAMRLLAPPTALAMRTPARRALESLIRRLPEGPSEEQRAAARFTIVCEARRGQQVRRGRLTGRDIYGLTAALVSEAARIASGRDFRGRGALAPSQAFEPRSFLERFERFELRSELPGEPVRAAAA